MLRIATRLACCVAIVGLATGCRLSLREADVTKSVASPDGTKLAFVANSKGPEIAAPPGTNFFVYVTKDMTLPLEVNPSDAVWASDEVPPIYVFWLDNETIEVAVYESYSGYLQTIRRPSSKGIEVRTRVIKDTTKAGLCEPARESGY